MGLDRITLRRASPADAPRISACVHAAYEHYIARIGKTPRPMLENYEKVIQQDRVVVAESSDGIADVLVLAETADGFRVMNVAVDPKLQKSGVGKRLLEFAEAEARRLGYDSIYLSTQEKMTENQALYSRIGYREYDRRIEDGYARVYMRKMLPDDAV
jgi:ribosomal protein S18 acetylase RimI-like enzyme